MSQPTIQPTIPTTPTIRNNSPEALLRRDSTFLWFDLDDTLWDMTGNSEIALDKIYATVPEVARAFGGDDGPRRWRDIYHKYNADLWVKYAAGTIDRDTLRRERFALPLQHAGMERGVALGISRALDGIYLHHLGNCPGCLPGAVELAHRLHAAGRRMGIVSNGFREVQYRKLASAGIDGLFEPVVLSDDTGVNKPAAGFFHAACAAAGVEPGQCMIIGDNPETDIAGAIRAGWAAAIWVSPLSAPVPPCLAPCADRVLRVATPADILALL